MRCKTAVVRVPISCLVFSSCPFLAFCLLSSHFLAPRFMSRLFSHFTSICLLFISPFSLFHVLGFLRLPLISFMSPRFIVLHFPLYPSGLFNFLVHVSHLPFLLFILLHLSFMSLHARSLPSVSPSVSLHFPAQIPSFSFIAFPRSCPFFLFCSTLLSFRAIPCICRKQSFLLISLLPRAGQIILETCAKRHSTAHNKKHYI